MQKVVNFYTIEDSKGNIRYVGETVETITKRSYKHLHNAKNPNKRTAPVHKWMYSLLQNNEKPIFKYLDSCNYEIWQEVEKMYISLFKSWGFNLLNVQEGGRVKITKELKINGNERSANAHKKKIFKLDDNLNKIDEFDSVKEASKQMGFRSISSISNCLKGRTPMSGGYYWCYSSDYPNNVKIKIKTTAAERSGIKIIKYDDLKNAIKSYDCIRDVLKEFLASPKSNDSGLKNAIKNKTKWHGFYWSLQNEKI